MLYSARHFRTGWSPSPSFFIPTFASCDVKASSHLPLSRPSSKSHMLAWTVSPQLHGARGSQLWQQAGRAVVRPGRARRVRYPYLRSRVSAHLHCIALKTKCTQPQPPSTTIGPTKHNRRRDAEERQTRATSASAHTALIGRPSGTTVTLCVVHWGGVQFLPRRRRRGSIPRRWRLPVSIRLAHPSPHLLVVTAVILFPLTLALSRGGGLRGQLL